MGIPPSYQGPTAVGECDDCGLKMNIPTYGYESVDPHTGYCPGCKAIRRIVPWSSELPLQVV